jgi:predicted Zn-dependent protease with MMP-like domain
VDAPIDDDTIEDWVAEAIEALPPRFRDELGNVAFLLEDRPTPAQLERLHVQGMYAYYEGVPRPAAALWTSNLPPPARITLFREPLLRAAPDRAGVRARVIETVHHEIAHHFGISDERLRELARERGGR